MHSDQQEHINTQGLSTPQRFWHGLLKIIRFYFISAGVFFTAFVLLLSLILTSFLKSDRKVTTTDLGDNIVVHLNLNGTLSDAPIELERQLIGKLFGIPEPIPMTRIRQVLRRASKDKRVQAVFVEYGSLSANNTTITELRRLLQEVRDAGKKVYGWGADLDTESYYLLSVSDRLYLGPAGGLTITGPVFQLMYLGDAIRKLGVDIEVVRAGKFKNAFESFVANNPSPETIEMYRSIEENLRSFYVEDIAANRNKPVDSVREWLKKSLYTSVDAKSEGLIDDLLFIDEVKDRIEEDFKKNDKKPKLVSVKRYAGGSNAVDEADETSGDEGIGFIDARGTIVLSAEGSDEAQIDPNSLRKEIEWAMDHKDIKSVVIRIDSPGGSATASDLIWRDLKRLALKKPLIVSMGSVAASGGYYMAVAGTKIYAEPTTVTGSIGVIGMLPNVHAFKEKYGVSFHVITQSDRAKMLNPGDTSSAFDKAIVENGIDQVYKLFLQRVAEGRSMQVEQVHELAQGRVYTGRQALELKLIDDLGGVNEAFRKAKELAGLDPNKLYSVYQYEGESFDLSDCLTRFGNMMECISELDGAVLGKRLLSVSTPFEIYKEHKQDLESLSRLVNSTERVFALSPKIRRAQ